MSNGIVSNSNGFQVFSVKPDSSDITILDKGFSIPTLHSMCILPIFLYAGKNPSPGTKQNESFGIQGTFRNSKYLLQITLPTQYPSYTDSNERLMPQECKKAIPCKC